jgi:hypothetical protein
LLRSNSTSYIRRDHLMTDQQRIAIITPSVNNKSNRCQPVQVPIINHQLIMLVLSMDKPRNKLKHLKIKLEVVLLSKEANTSYSQRTCSLTQSFLFHRIDQYFSQTSLSRRLERINSMRCSRYSKAQRIL